MALHIRSEENPLVELLKPLPFDPELVEAVALVCCKFHGKIGLLAAGMTPDVHRDLVKLFFPVGVDVRWKAQTLLHEETNAILGTYDQLIFESVDPLFPGVQR